MDQLLENLKEYLLEFQDKYGTGEPQHLIDGNEIQLIYNTDRSQEMSIDILNSISLLERIKYRNLIFTRIDYDYYEQALILAYRLKDNID